jgi:hypothetical protein
MDVYRKVPLLLWHFHLVVCRKVLILLYCLLALHMMVPLSTNSPSSLLFTTFGPRFLTLICTAGRQESGTQPSSDRRIIISTKSRLLSLCTIISTAFELKMSESERKYSSINSLCHVSRMREYDSRRHF